MVTKIIRKVLLSITILLLFGMSTVIVAPSNISADAVLNAPISTQFASDYCSDSHCIYQRYITPAIHLLSAAIGVLAVISFIVAGIQYSSAGSDPQKVSAARKRISNTVFGIVAYIFLFALLNWVVPGGLL
jgi:beta-lactamase regulating signal transducer with metallopeptidase domain